MATTKLDYENMISSQGLVRRLDNAVDSVGEELTTVAAELAAAARSTASMANVLQRRFSQIDQI